MSPVGQTSKNLRSDVNRELKGKRKLIFSFPKKINRKNRGNGVWTGHRVNVGESEKRNPQEGKEVGMTGFL